LVIEGASDRDFHSDTFQEIVCLLQRAGPTNPDSIIFSSSPLNQKAPETAPSPLQTPDTDFTHKRQVNSKKQELFREMAREQQRGLDGWCITDIQYWVNANY